MAIQNQPANLNQLNVISFQTNFLRMPMVDYFCQRVSIPGITSSSIVQTTPFADVPIEGDHLVFEDLSLDFIVDEDLKNYIEIFDWLKAIGFPDNFEQRLLHGSTSIQDCVVRQHNLVLQQVNAILMPFDNLVRLLPRLHKFHQG